MRTSATLFLCLLTLSLVSCGSSRTQTTSDTAGGDHGNVGTDSAATRSPDKLATDAAYAFLDTYTTDGGRIQRTDQGGDTVGEGQAYGMLAAAAVGDQRRFERIWSWTKDNMLQSNGLLAFHWAGGRVVDPHPAADADLDAARALLVASCRFDQPDLRAAGIRTAPTAATSAIFEPEIPEKMTIASTMTTFSPPRIRPAPRSSSEIRRTDMPFASMT